MLIVASHSPCTIFLSSEHGDAHTYIPELKETLHVPSANHCSQKMRMIHKSIVNEPKIHDIISHFFMVKR